MEKNKTRSLKNDAGPIQFHEDFSSLFEDSVKKEKREGEVAKGIIVALERDAVLVDVKGLKTEGRVLTKEFAVDGVTPNLQIGDEVEVFIEQAEGSSGRTILSRERAVKEESWQRFEDLFNKDEIVRGKIIGRVKGGFAVDIGGGLIAFLPGGQVDIRPINVAALMDKEDQQFKIVKMNREQGNIVVSRKAILEESRKEARQELLANIQEGSVLDGIVKNITEYGAFVDLGPVDGLLHITDISWNKISHPSEVLTIGQQLKVVVVKYNTENQRVSLGLKQLEANPWDGFAEKYKVGEVFKGSVTTITDYGAFVELEPSVEGLVYHTEISWNAKNVHPRKLLKTGDEVTVKVLEVDIAKHRISLSIKQAKDNPWQAFAKTYPVGSIVEGVVSNVEHFGVFVTVNSGTIDSTIDVIVPTVELSWEEGPERELKKYKKDDPITGVVVSVDVDRERVTLSVKQLNKSGASESAPKQSNKGSVVTCTVVAVSGDGIEVELEPNVKAFIKRADLSKHRAEQRPDRFAVGERVDVKVMSYDKATRKPVLSIKALEVEQERQVIKEYGSTDSGASLGDILGAALGKAGIVTTAEPAAEKPKRVTTNAVAEPVAEKPKRVRKKPAAE